MIQTLIEMGHGGWQTGCVHYDGDSRQRFEKDYNLHLGFRLHQELAHLGQSVAVTRQSDVYVQKTERKAIERRLAPQLVVSIHANSQKGAPTLQGMEGYYWPGNTDGKWLARRIVQAAPAELSPHHRRGRVFRCYDDPEIPNDDWISNPRDVVGLYDTTTVLVETGYMSYPGEIDYLWSEQGFDDVSRCLADAIVEWHGLFGG